MVHKSQGFRLMAALVAATDTETGYSFYNSDYDANDPLKQYRRHMRIVFENEHGLEVKHNLFYYPEAGHELKKLYPDDGDVDKALLAEYQKKYDWYFMKYMD